MTAKVDAGPGLVHVFELYVPTQCRCKKPLPVDLRAEALAQVKRGMSEWFGGGTVRVERVRGFWELESGELADEAVDVVYSNANAAAFHEYREDFLSLAQDVATRLSQEAVAVRIDGKMHFIAPKTTDGCVHTGMREEEGPSVPPKLLVSEAGGRRSRYRAIQAALQRLDGIDSARDLFCNVLHYDYASEALPTAGWTDPERACLASESDPSLLAEQNGFRVVYLRLSGERLLRTQERPPVQRLLKQDPSFRGLILTSDADWREWHLINVRIDDEVGASGKFILRRMHVSPQSNMRTVVERLALVDADAIGEEASAVEIQTAHDEAFDVEAVTREFFRQYTAAFETVEAAVRGFAQGEADRRRLFVQQLFNRLMFVAFVQKKGWLRINGDTDYLRALWLDYRAKRGDEGNFYRDRLTPLFFCGLSTVSDVNIIGINRGGFLKKLVGEVPFLNGGLFEQYEYDRDEAVSVPDACLDAIINRLFARFNFTVTESTPLDQEVAIDPEMLGTIFESLVTGRHEQGAYYTPKPIVSYMCREALRAYLCTSVSMEREEAVAELVENHDSSALRHPEKVLDALREVTVCDPACGSGAYLLGMLHELMALRSCLFATRNVDALTAYERKLDVIQSNVYGVDLDPFATNIAKLRLWLSLAVEFDGDDPPPLPNLEFKIGTGDSLTAPNPQGEQQLGFRDDLIRQCIALKGRYMRAHGGEKRTLKESISELRSSIADLTHHGDVVTGFDWAVEFAEVFESGGGFDIVVENPPFVRIQELRRTNPDLVDWLRANYRSTTVGNFDLYVAFVERSLQLAAPRGELALILPHKFFNAKYGRPLRELLARGQHLRHVVHFGDQQAFSSATNYVCLLFLARHGSGACRWVKVNDLSAWLAGRQSEGALVRSDDFGANEWSVVVGEGASTLRRVHEIGTKLGDIANIFVGLQTSADRIYVVPLDADIETGLTKPFLLTGNLTAYGTPQPSARLVFPYDIEGGRATPIAPTSMETRYPRGWAYLCSHRDALVARARGRMRRACWHVYPYPKNLTKFSGEKLIVQVTAKRPTVLYDKSGLYMTGGGSGPFYGIRPKTRAFSTKYLLALLNSSLFGWVVKAQSTNLRGGYIKFSKQYIETAPIRVMDLSDPDELAEHDAIVSLVDRILAVKAAGSAGETAELEREINERVYRLYGLSRDEIRVVESDP